MFCKCWSVPFVSLLLFLCFLEVWILTAKKRRKVCETLYVLITMAAGITCPNKIKLT